MRKALPETDPARAGARGPGARRTRRRLPVCLLAFAGLTLALASCGRPAAGTSSRFPTVHPARGFPLEVRTRDGGSLWLEAPPARVLPANAGVVDALRRLLPASRVAGVPAPADEYSALARDADAGWRALPRFPAYTAEVVLSLGPDLVLTHAWQSPETSALLAREGVPVLVTPIPETWDEVLVTVRFLGRVLDVEERAAEVEAGLAARVRELARWPRHGSGLRALSYSNLGTGGTAAGARTTVDVLLALAGLENAAARAGLEGHVPLDHERLLTLDPDLFLVAEEGGDGASTAARHLLETPALESLEAVRRRRVVRLPVELLTTTSLELVSAAEELQRRVDEVLGR